MRTEPQDELFKLVEENVEISKKILANTEKTRHAMVWMSVSSWVRTALWIVPIVLAAIYLPRLVQNIEERVNQTLGPQGAGQFQNFFEQLNNPESQKVLDQFRQQSPKK